jgi:hypothetical protein
MNKVLQAIVALQVLVTPFLFAEAPPKCRLCAGVVSDLQHAPASPVPLYLEGGESEFPQMSLFLASLTPETRSLATVVVDLSFPAGASVDEVERRVDALTPASGGVTGLEGFGVSLSQSDPALAGYALKRLAVKTQGLNIARRIALRTSPGDLAGLYETGAQAYFDEVVVDASEVEAAAQWLAEHDPSKRIVALAPSMHPNALFDAAEALAAGATSAFVRTSNDPNVLAAFSHFDEEMAGDYAPDSSAGIRVLTRSGEVTAEKGLAFVRGEDLRTTIVTPGQATEWRIVSIAGDEFIAPRRISSNGAEKVTDKGTKGGRTLIGLPPSALPYLLTVDRPNMQNEKIAKQSIEVVTQKGISVEEIIRNHQSYKEFQSSIEPPYIARDETKLRFGVGPGGDTIEATIAGRYFSSPGGPSDWVWDEFLVNGVKWKYGKIPELPIIQPEKVSQLPLDIHLTNDYRYQLVRQTDLRDYRTYEVRFEPPPNAPTKLPLYRGTVWIDSRTWARIRIDMIQLNLEGQILSNEEKVDFIPFDRASGRPLSAAEASAHSGDQLIWLPQSVHAQQVLSTAGRATVVLRATDFMNFELNPTDFEAREKSAAASDARIVRDTRVGMRYLDKNAAGERVVREGFDRSKMFLLGGLHHDAGLQFPVSPLGGIDYFNLDVAGKGLQTNIFFAGIITSANLTNPTFRGTRTNLGADFFAIAIPFENSFYQDGKEIEGKTVKNFPIGLTGRIGHPIFGFGKVDFSVNATYQNYQRSEKTAPDFAVPLNTFEITPSLEARYDRAGYSVAASYAHGTRTKLVPWGDLSEYSDRQKSFSRWSFTLGKSFYLPKFQRIGAEIDYIDGRNLDRFSKYELGFFGSERVRGVKSGSVRAEKGALAHLSYGFVFSQQFRLEAFYDYAVLDDASAGYSREPFQGLGLGGQTLGPWGTILRLDLGKSVGSNSQSDFVADIILLKLFDRATFRRSVRE